MSVVPDSELEPLLGLANLCHKLAASNVFITDKPTLGKVKGKGREREETKRAARGREPLARPGEPVRKVTGSEKEEIKSGNRKQIEKSRWERKIDSACRRCSVCMNIVYTILKYIWTKMYRFTWPGCKGNLTGTEFSYSTMAATVKVRRGLCNPRKTLNAY